MKFTLSWLKTFLDTSASLAEITERLTALGLEVEQVIDHASTLAAFKVAEILEAEKHPAADKLRVCKVNTGQEVVQIVCGAPNARAGIKVVMAPVGTLIPANNMTIKASQIRGVQSNGMLCSARELCIGEDENGIMELSAEAQPGESFVKAANLNDPIIEIAITPNRGDCLGVYGIARDLAASGLGTLKPLTITPQKGSFASSIVPVIEDTEGCHFFSGRMIKNVKNIQSPSWLQEKLRAAGQELISFIVDVTNYMALSFGQPMHAYDAKRITGGKLIARSAKTGETLEALNNKPYNLSHGMTVIADSEKVLGIAGIIGGIKSACTEDTTDIFLEAAAFTAINIAKTGRKLQIDSDARYRFERHVDSHFTESALELATEIILSHAGGEASNVVKTGSLPQAKPLTFRLQKLESLGGITLPTETVISMLEKLGCKLQKKETGALTLTLPTFRPDMEGEADIVEEILRLNGYDQLPAVSLPVQPQSTPALTPLQRRLSSARRILVGRGFLETVTFSFLHHELASMFGGGHASLQLLNPISADLDAMRPSLLPNLLLAIKKNAARGYHHLALFEIGPAFENILPEGQKTVIGALRSGQVSPRNIYQPVRDVDVFDIKADALSLFADMGLPVERLTITSRAPAWYHPGRSATLTLGKMVLGYIGELHPSILKALDISHTVVAMELFPDNAPVSKSKQGKKPALVLSDFQAVERDFAFIVDSNVEADQILRAAKGADKNLITEVSLFDVYQGKGVPDGKKSVAISVTMQAKDHTLTDEEIEITSGKIVVEVNKYTNGTLRE